MSRSLVVSLFILVSFSSFADGLLRDEKGNTIDQTAVSLSVYLISKIRLTEPNEGLMIGENSHGVVEIRVDETERFVTEIVFTSFVSIDPTSFYMISYVFGYFTQFNPMWVVFAYHHLWEEAPVIESVSTTVGTNGIATLERRWIGGMLVYRLTIKTSE